MDGGRPDREEELLGGKSVHGEDGRSSDGDVTLQQTTLLLKGSGRDKRKMRKGFMFVCPEMNESLRC